MKKANSIAILVALLVSAAGFAGGNLETYRRTGVFPFAGFETVQIVPIRWDARTLPVRYRVNSTFGTIPNPLGPAFLSLGDATTALQQSLDMWNQIPTSYVEMQIVGQVTKSPIRGFDMINELTFGSAAGFTAIASSPSTSFIADSNVPHGTDLDGDGDVDFTNAISLAADVDSDGDVEFPAGFYPAGTILDNDVQFNTKANGLRFTVNPAQADGVTSSVDLQGVAVHEFGHSFGLSHVLGNQTSATDGDGATMFPFIDTGDPASELSHRTPHIDDIAWASYYYPEGSASSGIAALQPGDVDFDDVFGIITGDVRHGLFNLADGSDAPISGASVFAIDKTTGAVGVSGYSGTPQLLRQLSTGSLFTSGLIEHDILDGRYVLPVPKGNYRVSIEAADGNPVPAANINWRTIIGSAYGLNAFNEEFWNGNIEAVTEKRMGEGKVVHVASGKVTSGVDFVTSPTYNINNYGTRDFVGFTADVPGRYYAVRIPASQIAAIGQPNFLLQGGLFDTIAWDSSTSTLFSSAILAPGNLLDATTGAISVDIANAYARNDSFLAQDNDFAPLFVKNPHDIGARVRADFAAGTYNSLFLILQLPGGPYGGINGFPPLIGLDGGVATNDVPIHGLSYTSDNLGATWTRTSAYNYRFSLVLSDPIN